MKHDILVPLPAEAKGNPRAASVRILAKSLSRASGQRRHDLRIGKQPDYVIGERTHLNRILVTLRSLPEIQRENEKLRDARGCVRQMKSNAAVVMTGIITFGHEAQIMFACLSIDQQDAAYLALAERIAERLGTRVESLAAHADEIADHAHFMLRGYRDDGQPVSKVATYAVVAELQDLTAEVMQAYCPDIERGHKKWDRIANGADYADTLNRSVKQLHEDLPREIAAREAELARLTHEAVALQASLEKTRGHLAKAEAQRDNTAARLKRVRNYEKRQAAKEIELARWNLDAAKARVEIEVMQATLVVQNDDLARRKQALDAQGAAFVKRDDAALDDKLQFESVAEIWRLDLKHQREVNAAESAQVKITKAENETQRREFERSSAANTEMQIALQAQLDEEASAVQVAKSQVAASKQEMDASADAFKQVIGELGAGTLKRGPHGRLHMRQFDVVNKAPKWVRKLLAPIVSDLLDLRARLAAHLTSLNDHIAKITAFLDRDDLTVAARAEAEALREDRPSDDIDGP